VNLKNLLLEREHDFSDKTL